MSNAMSPKIEPIAFDDIPPNATITIEEMPWGETYCADGRPIQCPIKWERLYAKLLQERMDKQTLRGATR